MYIAGGQGQSTPGDEILMSAETSCNFRHLLQVSKKSHWSLISYNFFHDFIHVYSPRAGADNPLRTKFWCQQEHHVTSVICCKFHKNLFEVLILYIFFHDFIHVYNPSSGADSRQGTKFWCQQKWLVTSFICYKFKKMSLKPDFIKFSSWFNTCI